jgi:hypothetical protein
MEHNVLQACAVRLMKHCLPKRFFKDMCFLVFCKMKIKNARQRTLNLQKPCTSARIAPWLAVIGSKRHTDTSSWRVCKKNKII